MDAESWFVVSVMFTVTMLMICGTFLLYSASPNRLCFVEGTGAVEGLLDVNAEVIPEGLINELKIKSFSGGFSAWIPCNRLGGN